MYEKETLFDPGCCHGRSAVCGFAIPASAKTESSFPMGDIYKTILGTNDIGYTLYGEGEYWDWTNKADTPNMTGVPSG